MPTYDSDFYIHKFSPHQPSQWFCPQQKHHHSWSPTHTHVRMTIYLTNHPVYSLKWESLFLLHVGVHVLEFDCSFFCKTPGCCLPWDNFTMMDGLPGEIKCLFFSQFHPVTGPMISCQVEHCLLGCWLWNIDLCVYVVTVVSSCD